MITCPLSPAFRTLRIEGAVVGKLTSTTLLRTDKTFPSLICSCSTFISSCYRICSVKFLIKFFHFFNTFHKPAYYSANYNKHNRPDNIARDRYSRQEKCVTG